MEESGPARVRLAAARPPIRLPDLAAVSVQIEPLEVGDAEVDERLEALRRDYASVTPADRPAREGDIVEIDLEAVIGGVPVPQGQAECVAHRVGSGHVLDGLDEALVGMRPGQSTVVASRLAGGRRAGEAAQLHVTVRSVFEAQVPDLDDAFARMVAEVSVEELREAVRDELARTRRSTGVLAARDQALAALTAAVGPLPVDDLIRADADLLRQLIVDGLRTKGRSWEQYLEEEGIAEFEIEARLIDSASRRLHCHLILDAVADEHGIDIGDEELRAIIMQTADRSRAPLRAFAEQLVRTDMVAPLYLDARRQKTLGYVLRTITIKDTAGKTVNLLDRAASQLSRRLSHAPD